MIPATETSSDAATTTIERVTGTADPASIGAGAGADENSEYSRATAAVAAEITRINRVRIAPPEAISESRSEKTKAIGEKLSRRRETVVNFGMKEIMRGFDYL
ncbi:hypothetical protein L6452_29652 [Arctium lappa]|uniref:Uncharacterized protein n=1 Tax=Arctium lappa TaxID=4217 RepID=A0ACB8ZH12_ARCLA|nr:hypothetical protein L6452_29652 [Arctium lappa]